MADPGNRAHAPLVASREQLGKLLTGFASLGQNCEFGLVQRKAGIEPLGLYRFAAVEIGGLTAAIHSRFERVGSPENVEVFVEGDPPEYFVRDKAFRFYHHTWIKQSEQTAETVRARELARLPLLIRMLDEDLANGDKIFVVKQGLAPISFGRVVGLARAIRAYGPGYLLWVVLADDLHPPCTIERLGANLLRAHIDRFAPNTNANDLDIGSWAVICYEARRMVDEALQTRP